VSDQFGEEQVAIEKNVVKDSWKGTVSDIQNFYSELGKYINSLSLSFFLNLFISLFFSFFFLKKSD